MGVDHHCVFPYPLEQVVGYNLWITTVNNQLTITAIHSNTVARQLLLQSNTVLLHSNTVGGQSLLQSNTVLLHLNAVGGLSLLHCYTSVMWTVFELHSASTTVAISKEGLNKICKSILSEDNPVMALCMSMGL